MKPSSVIVALSGGVDSSVAAALLKEKEWQVMGLHLMLPTTPDHRARKLGAAEQVADYLGIPLFVLDLRELFHREVIRPFAQTYLKGFTPNPCVVCNEIIKFDNLVRQADKREVRYVATGHYAILKRNEGISASLWRGKDGRKEQSYFLHRLKPHHVERTLFPLGEVTKEETRAISKSMGLPTGKEPESQEICFLPDGDYRVLIHDMKGRGDVQPGAILTSDGTKVGEHFGTYRYTIGQRHGLGIASYRPYYVMGLNPRRNEVIVGRKEDLLSSHVEAEDFNWVEGCPPGVKIEAKAQIRYRHEAAPGELEVLSSTRVRFRFFEPQWAITPGQALVCYHEERLLGGGWIKKKRG
jgi:tRNA-specific 2-thiouridylase